MAGDRRTLTRADKKTTFRPRQKGGGGSESPNDLLDEARARMEAGKYGKAASALKKILAKDPDHWEALRLSATLNLKLGSLFAARSSFESLARKALDRQDYTVAQSLLKEYLAVVPRYVPFLDFLGQALESSGHPAEAIVEYGKALEVVQESQDPEQQEQGAEIYRRLKALAPDHVTVTQLRAVYEPSAEASSPAVTAPAPPASPEPSPPPTGTPPPAADTARPWEGRSEPAPFPWEVGGPDAGPSDQPPAPAPSADDASRPAEPVQQAPAFRLAAETAPAPVEEPPPAEPAADQETAREPERPVLEPAAPEASAVDDPAAPPPMEASEPDPVLDSPVPPEEAALAPPEPTRQHDVADPAGPVRGFGDEPAFSTDDAGSRETEESVSETAAQTAAPAWVEADPTTESAPEPFAVASEAVSDRTPEPGPGQGAAPQGREAPPEQEAPTGSSGGFRFAAGPVFETAPEEPEPPSETSDAPPAARAGAGESLQLRESPEIGFAPPVAEPPSEFTEPAVETDEPPEHRPDRGEAAPAEPRRRRRGPEPAAPVAPTWAAAAGQTETHRLPPIKLFPTATKLRFRLGVLSRRVFSAMQSLTLLTLSLATAVAVLAVLVVAGLSLVWIGTEQKPDKAFYDLMKVPTPPLIDARQNGYRKLTAIGVTATREPVRITEGRVVANGDPAAWPDGFADLAAALAGWYGTWDPAAEFHEQRGVIRQWSVFFGSLMAKYDDWIGSPIEDVGYGSLEAPDEALVLGAHRLYVAEGFTGDLRRGLDRLRRDAEMWRRALAEARTLRFKMLAVEALNDDLAVASGLMARPDLPLSLLPILAEMSRPMNQAERSLRWPMQHQFALEMEMAKAYLRAGGEEDQRPMHLKALTYLPLPKQKIFNAHAGYYEALAKHDALIHDEGDPRRNMPTRYEHIRAPAKALSDYIANPVDTLLVKDDYIDWRDVIGRVVETEARLRLATLQSRVRRPPPVKEPIARIANAGQGFFDPFTGFTMLLNGSKTILYSVGRDGQDNDGDPTLDVSVPLYVEGP